MTVLQTEMDGCNTSYNTGDGDGKQQTYWRDVWCEITLTRQSYGLKMCDEREENNKDDSWVWVAKLNGGNTIHRDKE